MVDRPIEPTAPAAAWALVPTEPTREMLNAAFNLFELPDIEGYASGNDARRAIYLAMVRAAPVHTEATPAEPAEAPETLTDLLVTIEICVARDGAVHSDVQTHDNSWADVAIGLAAAKKEIELNFSERSKCPYHPSTREEANRKIVRATPPTALQEGAETPEVARLRRIAWLIGSIYCYGNFKAETVNEDELEKLLRENGTFWESVAEFEAAARSPNQEPPNDQDL